MKITKIDSPHDIVKLDMELTKGFVNDELFRTNVFTIHIEDLQPIDMLYRRMYEERYLNLNKVNRSRFGASTALVNITVGEAMFFVNKVTPPLIKTRYKNVTESIDVIKDLLTHFLIEETDQLPYHISEFQKTIGLNYFETQYSYDINRNNMLRQFNPSVPIIDMMTCTNFGALYNEDPSIDDEQVDIHIMYNCLLRKDLDIINKAISLEGHNASKISLLNIFNIDFKGYFVEIYIENYLYSHMKTIQNLFKSSYNKLM